LRIPTLPAEPDRPPICIALLLLRVGAGCWSFKQVAAAAGISPRLVSAYERGAEPLSRATLDELGAAMGFPPEVVDDALVVGEVLYRSRAGAPAGGFVQPRSAGGGSGNVDEGFR
jgi:transcriptional regulator with XRE-family HTH domain